MRAQLVLTIAAVACLTITLGFVRAATVTFDGKGPSDEVDAAFHATWKEGKKDEASREKLAWLCCQTQRVDDARKLFAQIHAQRKATETWSSAYSNDFGNMAQVEICATKFADALRFYEEQLDYDARFLPESSPQIKRDRMNLALVHALVAQTKSNDKAQQDPELAKADEALRQAASGTSGTHELMRRQTELILAEERGDLDEIRKVRKAVEESRNEMHVKVPVMQF